MTISSICFVTAVYPSTHNPIAGTFVEQLVCAVAAKGIECTVIHPMPVHHFVQNAAWSWRSPTSVNAYAKIDVQRTPYISASNRSIGGFNTYVATSYFFRRAVFRCLDRLQKRPDVVYGHFCAHGAVAAEWGKANGIPTAVAAGESNLAGYRCMMPGFGNHLRDVAAAVAVSRTLAELFAFA